MKVTLRSSSESSALNNTVVCHLSSHCRTPLKALKKYTWPTSTFLFVLSPSPNRSSKGLLVANLKDDVSDDEQNMSPKKIKLVVLLIFRLLPADFTDIRTANKDETKKGTGMGAYMEDYP
jgi:hypothetical protein